MAITTEPPLDLYRTRRGTSRSQLYFCNKQYLSLLVYAIELALNSSVSASTGLAPFEILYGDNVRLPLTLPSATDSAPTSWLSTQVTLRHPSHIVFLTFRYRPQPILWIFHFLASFRRKTIFHCSTPSLRSSDNSRILLVNIFGSSSFC